jgi:hypothetical protein
MPISWTYPRSLPKITGTDYIQFDTTWADGTAEGRLQWNIDDGTLEVGMPGGNVNLQIGQELIYRARNTTWVYDPERYGCLPQRLTGHKAAAWYFF